MNSLILKDQSGIITDRHILSHIHTTLKLSEGDRVRCTVLNSGRCFGVVKSLNEKECRLQLELIEPGLPQWFNLIVGLSRPQTMKKVLEHGTTYGARSIHFFKAALSEKSYSDSKIFEDEAYREFLHAGLSQSTIYTHEPEFKLSKYNPAEQYAEARQAYILDLNAEESFLEHDLDFRLPITLAIGPERGFILEDIERFHQAGFKSVKVSSTILRVEHAVYSAVSQLELLRKQF